MYIFKANKNNSNLLRAYTLKHCYEEARVIDKSEKSKSPSDIVANCIIIRNQRIKNESDFGYREQLKPSLVKKIFFVYLESVEDVIAFLWQHLQLK